MRSIDSSARFFAADLDDAARDVRAALTEAGGQFLGMRYGNEIEDGLGWEAAAYIPIRRTWPARLLRRNWVQLRADGSDAVSALQHLAEFIREESP